MMNSDKLLRLSLVAAFAFNLLAGYMVAFPSSTLSQLAGMTISHSPMHNSLSALMVIALGFSYAWLASQAEINKPLLGFGASVKGAAFCVFTVQWLFDAVTGRFVLFATADIIISVTWFYWLIRSSQQTR